MSSSIQNTSFKEKILKMMYVSEIKLPNGDVINLTGFASSLFHIEELLDFNPDNTAVVSIGDENDDTSKNKIVRGKNVFPIHIYDIDSSPIHKYFDDTYIFIKKNLDKGNTVWVHCYAGISRSPTIVIAYIMREFRMIYEEAFELVKKYRPIIKPNDGFVQQLKTFQLILEKNRIGGFDEE